MILNSHPYNEIHYASKFSMPNLSLIIDWKFESIENVETLIEEENIRPVTSLAEKLLASRRKLLKSGIQLYTKEEVNDEVARRRGEVGESH